MENYKRVEVQKINNNMEELLIVIQKQTKILQDTIIYYNEHKDKEMITISKPIFNKINKDKKLIILRMLSENIELPNQEISDKEFESEEEDYIVIIGLKMERSINKFLDAIDHLDFCQEYQVAHTISLIKTRLTANKRLYEEIKEINDPEIFDSFEEENMITLIESILITLEIIQDWCKTNNRTQITIYM